MKLHRRVSSKRSKDRVAALVPLREDDAAVFGADAQDGLKRVDDCAVRHSPYLDDAVVVVCGNTGSDGVARFPDPLLRSARIRAWRWTVHDQRSECQGVSLQPIRRSCRLPAANHKITRV